MTGTNFSDWYNPTEWTLMIAARRNYGGNFLTFPNLARINDGTNNNNVGLFTTDSNTSQIYFGTPSSVSSMDSMIFVASFKRILVSSLKPSKISLSSIKEVPFCKSFIPSVLTLSEKTTL
jgi:hypothetical protein